MRADAVWHHGKKPGKGAEQDPFKYCEKNLQKSLGHVYRAGYDAFDILALARLLPFFGWATPPGKADTTAGSSNGAVFFAQPHYAMVFQKSFSPKTAGGLP